MDLDVTKRLAAALEREGVEYVVFGGVALNLLGLARATQDLDLFVAPNRSNLEGFKRALYQVFEDPTIDEISVDELLTDYPAVQYAPPQGDFHLDILTRLGEAFRFEDLEAVTIDLAGQPIRVVSPATLYRMKRDTVRPKDRADAEAIRRRFDLGDF
jgi:hypothetical protein